VSTGTGAAEKNLNLNNPTATVLSRANNSSSQLFLLPLRRQILLSLTKVRSHFHCGGRYYFHLLRPDPTSTAAADITFTALIMVLPLCCPERIIHPHNYSYCHCGGRYYFHLLRPDPTSTAAADITFTALIMVLPLCCPD
jgi:hypothetical protein